MLASIMMLLQDGAQPQPPKPMIKIDRGGGGGMRYPAFEITDYVEAAGSFREMPGEDSVLRAARRANHIYERLSEAKRAKEQGASDAAFAFLLGAELQRRVEEAERAVLEAQLAQVRADAADFWATDIWATPNLDPAARPDGSSRYADGLVVAGIGLVAGILIGTWLARR